MHIPGSSEQSMYNGAQYINPSITEILFIASNFIQVFSVTLMKITTKEYK